MSECKKNLCLLQESAADVRIALLVLGHPTRMDHRKAMVYVNRKGKAFDAFIAQNRIPTYRHGGNFTREYLTQDLARGVIADCVKNKVAKV